MALAELLPGDLLIRLVVVSVVSDVIIFEFLVPVSLLSIMNDTSNLIIRFGTTNRFANFSLGKNFRQR